ncbi:MAG TPA: PLD nuclease N-terminal domain-containing protein [Woeseiaceae bacterium]|nr:PLD nuclease N-terminal domain-containing protein [Woeseiaceae bacterium]
MREYGILGILILVADIYAVLQIVKSAEDTGTKILWVLIVALLPVAGLIAWFLLGPGSPRKR